MTELEAVEVIPPTPSELLQMAVRWLRHKPEEVNLTLDSNGWIELSAVAQALKRFRPDMDVKILRAYIEMDTTCAIDSKEGKIRARYGHTVPIDAPRHASAPPDVLFACVPSKYVNVVNREGLQPQNRRYLTLSPERSTAMMISGGADYRLAVFKIDGKCASQLGVSFYPQGRGIWWSEAIPAECVSEPESTGADAPSGKTPGARRRLPRSGFLFKGKRVRT